MSSIVGQFVEKQTALNTTESLQIDSTANTEEESNESTESAKQNIAHSSLSSEAQEAQSNANPKIGKNTLSRIDATKQPDQPVKSVQPAASPSSESNNNPVSAAQPKERSESAGVSPTSTAKPKKVPQPSATTEAGATPKQKTTAAATPSQPATSKPSEPPKASAQTESGNVESKPADNGKVFDTSKVNSGTLGVRYLNTSGKRIKLMIEKGDSRYTYNLDGDGSLETFPLQSGNGEYTVSIMENTEGSKYRYLLTEKITVKASDSNSAYLSSVQMIKWNSKMAAIKKAAELTSGVSGDEAKVKKIYNYVVKNIRYDYDKLDNLPSTYIPSIDKTYKSKSGICYDFASLTAAMLRSVGIPTKLVMGYADGVNGYHAWNEVYMKGKWVVIDTSYDSQMRENGAKYSMIKSKSKYKSSKVY